MIQKSSGVCGYTTLCFLLNWPFPPCEVWHSSLASRCCSKIDVGWEFRLGQTRSWCVRHSPNNLCSLPESVHKYSLASFDKKPKMIAFRRACWKHFSVLVLVEVVEFHLGLSLSSKISGICPKRRWSFVEEHQVARSGVNYTSSLLISIFELLRKDSVFDNAASGRRLLKSPNESWYDFN